MRIYTTLVIFIAEGTSIAGDKREKVLFLFDRYEDAVKKAQDLIFQHFANVSAYRAGFES